VRAIRRGSVSGSFHAVAQQMRILLVDDHALVRDAISQGLELLGHKVTHAANANAAIAALEGDAPDVLVTDIEMPGMSGLELIERVRRVYPRLAIVAMSGRPVESGLSALSGLDAACKLQKPFTASRLMDAIERAREVA
jgi:CheY-like chemotaxis protein